MSASGAWGQAVDKVPLAHRLPPLIHPGSTLRREAPAAYPIGCYSNCFEKQTQPRLPSVTLHDESKASGHGQRRSPGYGVTLVDVKSLKQTLVPRPRKAPDGYK
jgi:hypothetical protein